MSGGTIDTVHLYPALGTAFRDLLAAELPGREIVAWHDPQQFADGIGDVEAILVLNPPRGHWAAATRLRLVQVIGAGVETVLPAPDLDESVPVCNAVGLHHPHMAEWVIAALLALANRFPDIVRQQGQRQWRMIQHRQLAGERLVVHGLGHVGAEVARLAAGLGMVVSGTKRTPEPVVGVDEVVGPERLGDLLDGARALAVVVPLTDVTERSVGAPQLAAMAEGAFLVDVSRGGVTDAEAVAAALGSGRLAGAVLDVFDEEPLPPDSPLWDVDGLVVSPHTAGTSPEYLPRVARLFAENVKAVESGGELRNRVPRGRGY